MHWSLAFVFLNLGSAWAKLVTTIIDDAFPGDTDSSITYFPSLDVWVVGSSTIHGRVSPDPSQAQDGTWHDTTDDTTPDHDGTNKTYFELAFKGTGIDIRCIIANNLNDLPPFTGTKADYSFFIDSIPQNQDYHHEASTTGDAFLYNTSVFSTNGLANAPHKLQLVLNGGPDVNGSVLLLFDYAIVTSEEDTVATSAPGPSLTSATGTSSSTQTSQSTIALSSTLTGTATGTSQVSTGTAGTSQISAIAGATVATPNQVSSALPTSPSSSHKLDIGAILGALGGGLLGLVLLFFAFLWIRRKRSSRPPRLPQAHILPFTDGQNPAHYTRPYSILRSSPTSPPKPKVPASSTSATTSEQTNAVMRDFVRTLRVEVEMMRRQQQELIATEPPPPRYEDT